MNEAAAGLGGLPCPVLDRARSLIHLDGLVIGFHVSVCVRFSKLDPRPDLRVSLANRMARALCLFLGRRR